MKKGPPKSLIEALILIRDMSAQRDITHAEFRINASMIADEAIENYGEKSNGNFDKS